jgi:hypothetical protein
MLKLNTKYEILTPSGWKNFSGIQEVKKLGQTKLPDYCGNLICSPNHRILYNNSFMFAKDLINSNTIDDKEFTYYDLLDVDENIYYTNGIISHNCEFLGSTNTLIAGWKLKQLEIAFRTPIAVKDGLYQYMLPEKEHLYAMVCDVSRGKGIDYSAFQLIDITSMPYRQACVFRSNVLPPVDYASVILHTAKLYNQAVVLVEINDIGEQVSHTLLNEFGYENILYTEAAGRQGKRVTSGFGGRSMYVDKGIKTTKTVKTVGCSLLKLLIEQDQLLITDHETIKEISTFVRKQTNYEAETNCHDDLVSCLFLFAWLSDQAYFKEHSNINTLMNLREKSEDEIEDDMLLFGFIMDGHEDIETPKGWKNVENPSWIRLPDLDYDIRY